jgi:hypothetical protein
MAYTRELILHELTVIRERLTAEKVLDESAPHVLDSMGAQIRGARSPKKWEFTVPESQALRFRRCGPTDSRDLKYNSCVDISGKFPAPIDGAPAKEHSVVVRIWTPDQAVWYNDQLDSTNVFNGVDPARGRVVHRFHFDSASSSKEPWCHMHVGGRRRWSKEFFRLPEDQILPRFSHHPMGLIQTCEFVLYHFFPVVYKEVSKEDSWQFALCESQKAYLGKYWARLRQLPPQGLGLSSFHSFCCSAC